MVLDVAQVPGLIRRAAMQVGLPRQQTGIRLRRRIAVACDFDQAELDFVDRQGVARLFVEMLQGPGRQPRLRRLSADAEMLAAAADGDIEGRLDLAQIFIQRPAKILQSCVIERREGDVEEFGLEGHCTSMPQVRAGIGFSRRIARCGESLSSGCHPGVEYVAGKHQAHFGPANSSSPGWPPAARQTSAWPD